MMQMHILSRMDAIVHNHRRILNKKKQKKTKEMNFTFIYAISTAAVNAQRVEVQEATWLTHTDETSSCFLFTHDEFLVASERQKCRPVVLTELAWVGQERNFALKEMLILDWIKRSIFNDDNTIGGGVDFVIKCDDDSYFVEHNFRHLLGKQQLTDNINPDDPLVVGRMYHLPNNMYGLPGGVYPTGGACYALSRGVFTKIADFAAYAEARGYFDGRNEPGDVAAGFLLHDHAIRWVDSRNAVTGEDTMHQENIATVITRGPDPTRVMPGQFSAPWFGLDVCSAVSVSFHYANAEVMHLYDFVLFRLPAAARHILTYHHHQHQPLAPLLGLLLSNHTTTATTFSVATSDTFLESRLHLLDNVDFVTREFLLNKWTLALPP
jgi:hypothetical protein